MKKGCKVRVLKNNQVGTIKEMELIHKRGETHRYCCVKMKDDGREIWLDASELGDVTERAVMTMRDEHGGEVLTTFILDYDKPSLDVDVDFKRFRDSAPGGLAMTLYLRIMEGLNEHVGLERC